MIFKLQAGQIETEFDMPRLSWGYSLDQTNTQV